MPLRIVAHRYLSGVPLAALAVVVVCSLSTSAKAENLSQTFGGGIFAGYAFGSVTGFEWGVEAFGLQHFRREHCSSGKGRSGIGPLFQVSLRGLSSPKFVLAVHGGGEVSRVWAGITGELGLSYRLDPNGGFDVHTGLVAESLYFNAAARYEVLRSDAWVGGGVRMYPTYGSAIWCD